MTVKNKKEYGRVSFINITIPISFCIYHLNGNKNTVCMFIFNKFDSCFPQEVILTTTNFGGIKRLSKRNGKSYC